MNSPRNSRHCDRRRRRLGERARELCFIDGRATTAVNAQRKTSVHFSFFESEKCFCVRDFSIERLRANDTRSRVGRKSERRTVVDAERGRERHLSELLESNVVGFGEPRAALSGETCGDECAVGIAPNHPRFERDLRSLRKIGGGSLASSRFQSVGGNASGKARAIYQQKRPKNKRFDVHLATLSRTHGRDEARHCHCHCAVQL